MTITLNLLKCFRHLAQAASRIACVLGVTGALLLNTTSYANAPVKALVKIQMNPKAYAKANLSLDEYKCINKLYYHESRWNPKARNGSMYGIPQGNSIYLKNANPIEQVKWGLSYIKSRYGSTCKALNHYRIRNWH